jgi:hypothetical protein
MVSPLRLRALSSLIGIAALGVAIGSCGSSVDVEPASPPPPTGGGVGGGSGGSGGSGDAGAGGETIPPDPPPPDPEPDAGTDGSTGGSAGCDQGRTPFPSTDPGGPACSCPSSPGITLTGDCGPLTLTAPYVKANDLMYCSPSLAYAYGFFCSGNFTRVVLNACLAEDTAPCIRINWVKPSNPNGSVAIDGELIDGAGELFTLSDITLTGDLPWNGPAATGTFAATGTGTDGKKPIKIQGSFDLCVAEWSACPN